MDASHEDRRSRATKAVRVQAGLDRIKKDWTTFFSLVAAAPDRETLEEWIIDRFRVERDVAEASLHETVGSMLPRPGNQPTQ